MGMVHPLPRQQAAGTGGASSGSNGTAAIAPKNPMIKPPGSGLPPLIVSLRKLHSRQGMYILWWTLCGIVGVLAILHAASLLRARFIRKRVAAALKTGATPTVSRHSSTLSAIRAMWANFCYVRVPVYLFPSHSASEYFWTATYVTLVIGITFWASVYNGKRNYASVFGLALPLIIGLAGRNNLISLLTGISYEKINWLHRTAGRTCVLTAWTHMGAMVDQVRVDVKKPVTATGILGLTCVTLMFLSSFGIFRRLAYEVFIVLHIFLGITLLVAIYYHCPMYRVWVWSSMVIWGFDRFVSFLKLAWVNLGRLGNAKSTASVSLLAPGIVQVVAHAPKLKWRAGQHAFVMMPSVARLPHEAHPFTMANIPSPSGSALFIVRAHSGFTRRLVVALESSTGEIPCYIDGPYGLPPNLNHYAGVLLLAGGTGITYTLSHLLDIIRAAREGSSTVSSVRLVWNTRDTGDNPAAWIAPLVNEALNEGAGPLRIQVNVHITNDSAKGETAQPASRNGSTDGSSNHEKAVESGVISVTHGRSDIEGTIRTDVASTPGDAGGMAVVVCGPTSMSLDTRRAVCRVNTAVAVAKGQTPIEFYAEQFSW